MKYHLDTQHKEIKLTPATSTSANSNTTDGGRKSTPYASIFNLRSKKDRQAMLQTTIDDWKEAKHPLDFNSIKAQKIHRSIFECMIVDLIPFTEVNKPGFLRHHALLAPNFEVASDKYYRSLLDPTYDRIRDEM